MDISNSLFQAVSGLMGGLTTDIKTLMLSIVVISFLCLGAGLLKDIIFSRGLASSSDISKRIYQEGKEYQSKRLEYIQQRGTLIDYDSLGKVSRKHLKKII